MIGRVILTLVVLGALSVVSGFVDIVHPLVTGTAATWQLQNSDVAYIASQYGMRFGSIAQWGTDLALIAVLAALWFGPVRRLIGTGLSCILVAGAVTGLVSINPALAYYDTTDYPEWQNIMPNETGFLIPVVGANKDSQAKFASVDYLKENKVAAKRVQIPHTPLLGSGYVKNSVVPSAQLVIVDRSPYQREWTKHANKGTSTRDESMVCESRDSYSVGTAITIAAYVTEDDASAFLYHFGSPAQGKRDDPNVVFASVIFGRSLEQVMDTNVRGKVHASLCAHMATYDLNSPKAEDRLFNHKADIMAFVEKEVKELYRPMGISIEYIGFADELTYDPAIQGAINRVFTASKEAEAAIELQKALPVLQAEAQIEVLKGLAKGLGDKGLPALPTVMMDPKSVIDMITPLFHFDQSSARVPPPAAPRS